MASEAQLATLQAIALVVSAHRQNCGFKKISEIISMNYHNIKNTLINSFGNFEKSIIFPNIQLLCILMVGISVCLEVFYIVHHASSHPADYIYPIMLILVFVSFVFLLFLNLKIFYFIFYDFFFARSLSKTLHKIATHIEKSLIRNS